MIIRSVTQVICDVPSCSNTMDVFEFWSIEIKGTKMLMICERCKDNLIVSASMNQIDFDRISLN